jgi:hypothetical protein
MRGYRKGDGSRKIYRGKIYNQRDLSALYMPDNTRPRRLKIRSSSVKFYYGPPEKQKDPRAINMYNSKKDKGK